METKVKRFEAYSLMNVYIYTLVTNTQIKKLNILSTWKALLCLLLDHTPSLPKVTIVLTSFHYELVLLVFELY